MSYKHTPATDALDTLGSIISDKEKRDAIHLGVDPATAGQPLKAGEHVILKDGVAKRTFPGKGIGIVDPFLLTEVKEGQKFWLVVYPRQITSLRHVWEHPAFPLSNETSAPADKSKVFLEQEAARLGVSLDSLLSRAECYQEYGDYWVEGGRFEGEYIGEDFWDHYEIYMNRKVSDKGNFLSCSC